MSKKILVTLITILLAVGLVGGGAFAYLNDTETSKDNTFTAGTLDLKVDGQDDPTVICVEISNIAPGWGCRYTWVLKNVGSLPGILSVEISDIKNYENGFTEPEYNPNTAVYADGESSGDVGELGDEIIVGKVMMGGVKPRMKSPDGYKVPWTKALNYLGERTLYAPAGSPAGILESDEEETFFIDLRLDEIVGNQIQGDSCEFDIIFHLDQVP